MPCYLAVLLLATLAPVVSEPLVVSCLPDAANHKFCDWLRDQLPPDAEAAEDVDVQVLLGNFSEVQRSEGGGYPASLTMCSVRASGREWSHQLIPRLVYSDRMAAILHVGPAAGNAHLPMDRSCSSLGYRRNRTCTLRKDRSRPDGESPAW